MEQAAYVNKLRLKFPGQDTLLFKDLTLSFKKGEKVLFLGPSGCGKSTLLQVLAGLIPKAIDLPMKVEEQKVPGRWGYVFQDPDAQFCMPYVDEELAFVLENLQIPREEMDLQISEILSKVGLHLKDPHVEINTLSGGMKQRLAIAAALLLQPEVLFLDEPTALIDPKGTEEIWETIKQVSTGKTVLIVEHKIDHVLDFVDRIILFGENGEILADGPKNMIFHQYKAVIQNHGIWYPTVWEDYKKKKRIDAVTHPKEEVVRFRNFFGIRKKEVKVSVEEEAICRGDWLVITGENGAGKSTLLQAMTKLIPSKGLCEIEGVSIDKIKNLFQEVAFVFQNPEFQFVSDSVFEELAFGLRLNKEDEQAIEQKVEEFLRLFHLKGLEHLHPYQLSMGQKRRLSVAASIMNQQKLLLLDEPTFGQDARNTFALLDLLEQLRQKGTTIVMVTHDEEIVEHFATKRWVIENGHLVQVEALTRPQSLHVQEGWA